MKEGSIILATLPQSNGKVKPRPALVIKKVPPFEDFLVCGISSQLRQEVPNFDLVIKQSEPDFANSGLLQTSLIRVGFLSVLPVNIIAGSIGNISVEKLSEIKSRLAKFILS